jgi:CRP-like cAMP-binding protein
MPKPPPLNVTASADAPLDRAMAFAASGDAEWAIRWAVPLVKADLSAVVPLFVLGQQLRALDQTAGATLAFETAADRAADNGNLPMALASIAELRALKVDVAVRTDAVAKIYAKGSPRLKAGGAGPPPVAPPDVQALHATLTGPPLIEAALQVLDYARAAFESDRDAQKSPPLVPAQGIFSSLKAPDLRALIGAFDVVTVPKGEKVVEQGAPGAEAFVLARGELEVVREQTEGDGLLLARLGNGAVFGEMALLSRSPRAASVVAARPSVILIIRVGALDDVARSSPEVGAAFAAYCHRRMVANLVRTSPLLGPLSASERQALIERFSARTFEAGERIIVQGQASDGLHVIASGEVSIVRREGEDEVVIVNLGVGEVIGEVSLVFRRTSNADVVATHPTMTLHLPSARFMEIVREHPTLLAQLYELAAQRDEETASIAAQEASDAEELMI